MSSLRGWPAWQLPRWIAACITAVVAAYVTAVAWALASETVRPGDSGLCAVLVGCGAVSAELTHRTGSRRPGTGISRLTVPQGGTAAIRVTISIGVAVPSQGLRTLDDLLTAADHALYQVKGSGRVIMHADTRVPQAGRPLPLTGTSVLPG